MEQVNQQTTKKKIKLDFKDSKYATGRRKKIGRASCRERV